MENLNDSIPFSSDSGAGASDGPDAGWMRLALKQARAAAAHGEVPVGAVLLSPGGSVLAEAGNAPVAGSDPTAHAEMLVLRAGGAALGNYRLSGCTLYVTLEPCPMCMSAIAMARVARLVYGAADSRLGACGGAMPLSAHPALNTHTRIEGGVLADECAGVLKGFFEARRPPKSERLQRIARLEDVPNIDPALSQWLAAEGFDTPVTLLALDDTAVMAHLLQRCATRAEWQARLKAIRHFAGGGAALPWKQFLGA